LRPTSATSTGGQNALSNGFPKFHQKLSKGFSGLPKTFGLKAGLNTKMDIDMTSMALAPMSRSKQKAALRTL